MGEAALKVEGGGQTEPPTIEPGEIATVLGVGLNSVYEGLRNGEIPSLRVGRRWIVSRRRFMAWFEGGE